MIHSLCRLLRLMVMASSVAAAAAAAAAQSSQSAPAGETIPRQTGTPLPLKPDLPGMARNHRLILKDGSYQLVREYRIVGDRLRYLSQERGDWEEMPVSLVDWDATRKWEKEHAAPDGDETSPGMQDAAEVDKEELEARNEQKALMPEVAAGLELPNQDGVFVLDTYHGTPELVELKSKDLNRDAKTRHGVGILDPLAGRKGGLEIEGAHAKIDLHVNDPAFYLSLNVPNDHVTPLSQAITVNLPNVRDPADVDHGARSAQSTFAIVRLDQRNALRLVGPIHVSPTGAVTPDENVIPAKVQAMPGKHWLRIQPQQTLLMGGEYALVEILSPNEISPSVWDFRVDPTKGDNSGSLTPILAPVDSR